MKSLLVEQGLNLRRNMRNKARYCPPFVEMAPIVPEGSVGNVSISHMVMEDERVQHEKLMSMMSFTSGYGRETYDLQAGTYCKLINDGRKIIEMTDTPMERRTNLEFIRNAHGSVLIGGLGIGMIIVPLLTRESVTDITVVEINQDIIDLVWSHIDALPRTCDLNIVCADVMTWRPENGIKFDSLYFDIWPDISGDNWDDMKKISRSWWHWRRPKKENPDAFMSLWRKDDVKRDAYRDYNSYW